MDAKATVRRNRVDLCKILRANYQLILNKVDEKSLITEADYDNLQNVTKESVDGYVNTLLNKIMGRGEDTCQGFIHLLQTDEDIIRTFPDLKKIQWASTRPPSPSYPIPSTDASPYHAADTTDSPSTNTALVGITQATMCSEEGGIDESERYQLSTKPVGLCLIINNENFKRKRKGTNEDARSLAEVFSWLGFRVLMCKDLTKDQMDQALKNFASLTDISQLQVQEWSGRGFTHLQQPPPQHGDAFICCMMSHGDTGGVKGVKGALLPIKEITKTFNGANCRVLVNKPKVFFIQACQGAQIQPGVEADLEADDQAKPIKVPLDADFLVAVSTVEGYKSYRDTEEKLPKGSWFMQSLCKQLRERCPSGGDLLNILCRVNNDVSQKDGLEAEKDSFGNIVAVHPVKQMPEVKFTLRKTLVFKPC